MITKGELIERQLAIYTSLREAPNLTLLELAKKMSVSESTISREIKAMKNLGISMAREGGKKKTGYWLVKIKNKTS